MKYPETFILYVFLVFIIFSLFVSIFRSLKVEAHIGPMGGAGEKICSFNLKGDPSEFSEGYCGSLCFKEKQLKNYANFTRFEACKDILVKLRLYKNYMDVLKRCMEYRDRGIIRR